MNYDIVKDWTAPVDIDLLSQGETPEGTMAGMTVVLILKDEDGNSIDTSGDLVIQDSTLWKVRWTPDTSDLIVGIFRMRVKVTDVSGGVSFFPSGEWDTLYVWDQA